MIRTELQLQVLLFIRSPEKVSLFHRAEYIVEQSKKPIGKAQGLFQTARKWVGHDGSSGEKVLAFARELGGFVFWTVIRDSTQGFHKRKRKEHARYKTEKREKAILVLGSSIYR